MDNAVLASRIQFAFTVMFHYLFPILTMGLGFFIALYSTLELKTGEERYGNAAHFWGRFSLSILRLELLPVFRSNSNSAPTGAAFRVLLAASSARPCPSQASMLSSWSPVSWGCFSLAAVA
jgi:hypothetical protein